MTVRGEVRKKPACEAARGTIGKDCQSCRLSGPMLLSVAAERGNRKPSRRQIPGGDDCPGKPSQVGPDFLISWPKWEASRARHEGLEAQVEAKPGLLIVVALIRLPTARIAGTIRHV